MIIYYILQNTSIGMMTIPMGVMPDKPFPVDTLLSVLRRRLKGEKDVSIRKFIRSKIKELSQPAAPEKKKEPFLIEC